VTGKAGQTRKGRERIGVPGLFGTFKLERDYDYHAGKEQGNHRADAALGLEVGDPPALAKRICLEGADEPTCLKAERHLEQTGGMTVSARQIQRAVQRVGGSAPPWQEREPPPGACGAPVLYVSADGTGVPMAAPELKGRRGKQADGTAKTRQVYPGCVFTQHRTDEQSHLVRDYETTTYISSFQSIDEFGPGLRQEAIGRGMGSAGQVGWLIDGAAGLENIGRLCFKDCVQIVDFYRAMEHAGQVLAAWLGKGHPDYPKPLRRWATAAQRQGPGVDSGDAPTLRGHSAGSGGGTGPGILRPQREPDAIRHVPGGGLVHRLGRGGSGLQDRHWWSVQTIRHVLVQVRGRKHSRAALPSSQPEAGRLLERPTQPTRRPQRHSAAGGLKEEFCLTPAKRCRRAFCFHTSMFIGHAGPV